MIFSIANDVLDHPRVGRLRISTIGYEEPQSYGIMAAPEVSYVAETIIWAGPEGAEKMRDLIRYDSTDAARTEHAAIVARSTRSHATREKRDVEDAQPAAGGQHASQERAEGGRP